MVYLRCTLFFQRRLAYIVDPTPDHDLPHIYVLECNTRSWINAHYYLATHLNPFATVGSKPIAFPLGAFTKSSPTIRPCIAT
ncbi:hypothetical protein M405DRAFT_336397 [Rhizopogon salebrosus TDB-379]|nr:hypothetical protein M405DRAFT_336397 [Rhizopogon salebrosus TDB-379]